MHIGCFSISDSFLYLQLVFNKAMEWLSNTKNIMQGDFQLFPYLSSYSIFNSFWSPSSKQSKQGSNFQPVLVAFCSLRG